MFDCQVDVLPRRKALGEDIQRLGGGQSDRVGDDQRRAVQGQHNATVVLDLIDCLLQIIDAGSIRGLSAWLESVEIWSTSPGATGSGATMPIGTSFGVGSW